MALSQQTTFGIILEVDTGKWYRLIHNSLTTLRALCLRKLAENDIGRDVRIALRAYIDLTNPHGVHIGDGTLIETGAVVLAHNPASHSHLDTCIGRNCFIGVRAVIMPGIRVGDQSIVIAGSFVNSDVPAGSMVAGLPARVVRSGIRTGRHGLLLDDGQENKNEDKGADPESKILPESPLDHPHCEG